MHSALQIRFALRCGAPTQMNEPLCTCGTCRRCRHRETAREWRKRNPEKVKEWARASARRRYAKLAADLEWREAENARLREYYAANPDTRRATIRKSKARAEYLAAKRALYHSGDVPTKARILVARAIRAGVLERPTECSRCGHECKPEGHHIDYSRPLDVEWLCQPCHYAAHGAVCRPPLLAGKDS